MSCRCAERRGKFALAGRAALRADSGAVKAAAGFIARSTIEDVAAMARRMAMRNERRPLRHSRRD